MKNISVSFIDKLIGDKTNDSVVIDFYGAQLEIKTMLSLEDMIVFVSNAVSACFNSDTNAPQTEVKDFVIKANTISMYTNIRLPENMSKKYTVVYKLYGMLEKMFDENINLDQYYAMTAAIDEKIQYNMDSNIDSITDAVNSTISSFEKLSEYANSVLKNVDINDATSFVKSYTDENGKIDEGKIIDLIYKKENNG